MDDNDLTLLIETFDLVQLASVKSLLDAYGISHVAQGERHASLIGGLLGNPSITPRILVATRDLERARQLLAAEPQSEVALESHSLGGGLCPVHRLAAVATCGRCGSFLCANCKALGQPPMCDECSEAELAPQRTRSRHIQKAVVWILLAPFIISLALGLLSFVATLFSVRM